MPDNKNPAADNKEVVDDGWIRHERAGSACANYPNQCRCFTSTGPLPVHGFGSFGRAAPVSVHGYGARQGLTTPAPVSVNWWDCDHRGAGLIGCPTCDGELSKAARVALVAAHVEICILRSRL